MFDNFSNWYNELPMPVAIFVAIAIVFVWFKRVGPAVNRFLDPDDDANFSENQRINNRNRQAAKCPKCNGKESYKQPAPTKSRFGGFVKHCKKCDVEFVPRAFFE